METHKLGLANVDVSALCLGAMYFGSRNSKSDSYRLLNTYVDAGGSFIDTANIYAWWVDGCHGGESETLMGEWMQERGNRSRLFIASKVGFGYGDVPRTLSARWIEEECNKSLKRMKIETIDLYYAHVDDRSTPLEETLGAFDKLVKAGKVRYVGASNYLAWRLEQAKWVSQTNQWAQFCCIQQHYTYLPLRPGTTTDPQVFANEDLLDYCRSTGMTMLAYSALQSGAYTRPERSLPGRLVSADNNKRLATLRAVAQEAGVTVNQVILRWMLQRNIIPLIAASTQEQMNENIGALQFQLNDEQMQRLKTAGTE